MSKVCIPTAIRMRTVSLGNGFIIIPPREYPLRLLLSNVGRYKVCAWIGHL